MRWSTTGWQHRETSTHGPARPLVQLGPWHLVFCFSSLHRDHTCTLQHGGVSIRVIWNESRSSRSFSPCPPANLIALQEDEVRPSKLEGRACPWALGKFRRSRGPWADACVLEGTGVPSRKSAEGRSSLPASMAQRVERCGVEERTNSSNSCQQEGDDACSARLS